MATLEVLKKMVLLPGKEFTGWFGGSGVQGQNWAGTYGASSLCMIVVEEQFSLSKLVTEDFWFNSSWFYPNFS